MSLSISELKKIDNYLKSKGVEFWDVRFEFTDHMACFVEEKLSDGDSFELSFTKVEKDFTRSYLRKQQKQIQKKLNKYIRKTYLREIKNTLTNSIYLIALIVFGGILKFVMQSYSVKYGLWIGCSLMVFLLVITLARTIKHFKMYKQSLLLNLSGTHVVLFSLFFQIIV